MKYRYLFLIIIIVGIIIYGPSIFNKSLSTKEKLQEYINSIKTINDFGSDLSEKNPYDSISIDENGDISVDINELQNITDETSPEFDRSMIMEVRAPIMKKLLNMFPKSKNKININEIINNIYLGYLNFAKLHFDYGIYCFLFAILVVILSFLLSTTEYSMLVSMIGRFGFFLSRFFLVIFSITAMVFFLLIKRNLWIDAGVNIFLGPLVILLGTSIALKNYDPNFPIWNRTIGSMIFPFISSILIMGGNSVI